MGRVELCQLLSTGSSHRGQGSPGPFHGRNTSAPSKPARGDSILPALRDTGTQPRATATHMGSGPAVPSCGGMGVGTVAQPAAYLGPFASPPATGRMAQQQPQEGLREGEAGWDFAGPLGGWDSVTRAQCSHQSLAPSRWCGMCGAGVFSQYLAPPNWCPALPRASGWCGAQCFLCSTWYL